MRTQALCSAALLVLAITANAQVPTEQDYCTADPLSQRVAQATAFIVPLSQLETTSMFDYYRILHSNYTYQVHSPGDDLCPDVPYYDRVRANWGRTGFLVGKQHLVTAPHDNSSGYDLTGYAVIFRSLRRNKTGGSDSPDITCSEPDFEYIHASDIYTFSGGFSYNTNDIPGTYSPDYVVFELDRPVTGVEPLPLRRSGAPLLGDPLLIAAHNHRLPLKLVGGGYIGRVGPTGLDIGNPMVGHGASGSPVFNLRSQVVETAVARSQGGLARAYDSAGKCWRPVPQTADLGAGYNEINNGPMDEFVTHVPVPPDQLQVTSLAPVHHTNASGGGITNAVSQFSVSLPASATASQDFRVATTSISPQNSGPTELALTLVPPAGTYTLAPGATLPFTVAATSSVSICGQFDAEVRVSPASAGKFASVIPHRFDLSTIDFNVTPESLWDVTQIVGPYPTRTLTVTNTKPYAVSLIASASQSWLKVNGGSSATVNLAAAGASGSSASVIVSFASNAEALVAPGTRAAAEVTFAPTTAGCSVRGNERMDVSFAPGEQSYQIPNPAVPLAAPTGGNTFGAYADMTVDLSHLTGKTVGDLDLDFSFVEDNLISPPGLRAADAAPLIKIVLESPSGLSLTLWDRNSPPVGYTTPTVNTYSQLRLDDATTPPLGGSLLSAVNSTTLAGIWKVRVATSSPTAIYLETVTLKFKRQP
ncbi:serine protease [Tahibacter sp.]|uniref:serine protease n=1 Tax=Tahibacter sp. TaxID=2056211 RepID=UPI0028C38258|nr:serine protease [Tahibacter sp.]